MLKEKTMKPKRTKLEKKIVEKVEELKPVKKAVKKDNIYTWENAPKNGTVILANKCYEVKNGIVEIHKHDFNNIPKEIKEVMKIRKA